MAEAVCTAAVSRRRTRTWVWGLAAALLSGVLLGLAFPPVGWHWLLWVAMVPWLLVLPRLGPWSIWGMGLLLGLAFYRIGLDWLFGLYGPFATIFIMLMTVLLGFAFRVSLLLIRRLGNWSMIWVVPFCFTAQEIIRAEGLPLHRFPHLVLGYGLYREFWLAQIASLGGVFLLTFLIVMFNAALAWAILARRWSGALAPLAVAALTASLAAVAQPRDYASRPRIPVAAVQEESTRNQDYKRWTAEAAAHESQPRFIVLPEHTIVNFGLGDEDMPLLPDLKSIAQQHGCYICVGAHTRPPAMLPVDPTERRAFLLDKKRRAQWVNQCPFDNCALLLDPAGRLVHKQVKVVPVPFYQDGNPGTSIAHYATEWGRVGTYVCYDESFSDVMRRYVDSGADLLLGPVWNTKTWPAAQRLQQAEMMPLRAIEQRRCMVRAASSGVSQIIDATGHVTAERTQREGSGFLCGTVYFNDQRTVFNRFGWLFGLAIGWGFIVLTIGMTLVHWWHGLCRLKARLRKAA